ncbi:MAG: PorV/PorQ family protein [Melioribacteraceae bacterium]|nr:MAG: PorV/PorQ family protein [Melioribacteraceae bacterium]
MKKNIYKHISVISLLISLSLSAQDKAGVAGAHELLIPTSAVGLSLSDAYIAGISGLDALTYNPAGLFYIDNDIGVMFSYMQYLADINFSYAAIGFKFENFGVLAVNVRNLDFGEIPITTVEKPYGTGENFSPTYITAGITYSNSLSDNLTVGVSANLVTEKILQTTANTISFDLGFQIAKMFGIVGLKLGGVLKNLGPELQFDGADLLSQTERSGTGGIDFIKYDTPEFELPLQVQIGIAYDKKITEDYSISFSTAFQSSEYFNNEYKIGGEFSYDNLVYLRGGYTYIKEADENSDNNIFGPSFGAGFRIKGDFNVIVDYGFRQARFFSNNHIISVSLGF